MIKLKRVYEKASNDDGFRILVDRLWPRGLSKQRAKVDLWAKEIAPSDELRKWFSHDPRKWAEFKKKYAKELEENDFVNELKKIKKKVGKVSLIYSASDEAHNNAVVLKELLER